MSPISFKTLCAEVVGGPCGVHDPPDALLAGLVRVGVEADEVGGVAAQPDVQGLRLRADLLRPLGLYPGAADELHLQGVQTEAPRVLQRTLRGLPRRGVSCRTESHD